jgi:heptosyltransferase-3
MAEETLTLCPERPVALLGGMTLGSLAALIQRADLFLGVDSAPMHIAAAVGTPLIGLFGPSNEKIWGPWGQTEWIVRHPCICLETRQRHCAEAQGMKCLNDLTVEELLEKLRARLAANDMKHSPFRTGF